MRQGQRREGPAQLGLRPQRRVEAVGAADQQRQVAAVVLPVATLSSGLPLQPPISGIVNSGTMDRNVARRMERGTVWKDRPKRVMAPYPNPMPGLAGSQVGRNT